MRLKDNVDNEHALKHHVEGGEAVAFWSLKQAGVGKGDSTLPHLEALSTLTHSITHSPQWVSPWMKCFHLVSAPTVAFREWPSGSLLGGAIPMSSPMEDPVGQVHSTFPQSFSSPISYHSRELKSWDTLPQRTPLAFLAHLRSLLCWCITVTITYDYEDHFSEFPIFIDQNWANITNSYDST